MRRNTKLSLALLLAFAAIPIHGMDYVENGDKKNVDSEQIDTNQNEFSGENEKLLDNNVVQSDNNQENIKSRKSSINSASQKIVAEINGVVFGKTLAEEIEILKDPEKAAARVSEHVKQIDEYHKSSEALESKWEKYKAAELETEPTQLKLVHAKAKLYDIQHKIVTGDSLTQRHVIDGLKKDYGVKLQGLKTELEEFERFKNDFELKGIKIQAEGLTLAEHVRDYVPVEFDLYKGKAISGVSSVDLDYGKGIGMSARKKVAIIAVLATAACLIAIFAYFSSGPNSGSTQSADVVNGASSPQALMGLRCVEIHDAAEKAHGIADEQFGTKHWENALMAMGPVFDQAYLEAHDAGIANVTNRIAVGWGPAAPLPPIPVTGVHVSAEDKRRIEESYTDAQNNHTMDEYLRPKILQFHLTQAHFDAVHDDAYERIKNNASGLPFTVGSPRFNQAYAVMYAKSDIPDACAPHYAESPNMAAQYKARRQQHSYLNLRTNVVLGYHYAARSSVHDNSTLPAIQASL